MIPCLVGYEIFIHFSGTADIVINAISELYMVLPYFKNGTLHDHLEIRSIRKQYMEVDDILRIFNDICEAVKCFHDQSPEPLAHRDLKTANVCLTESMSPILMDLGQCKLYFFFSEQFKVNYYTVHIKTFVEQVLILGSVAPARVQVCGSHEAQKLQDLAAERCSMPYR